jgi:phosphoglycolate phosphatase-like HAD superfamily hydrolase
MTDQMTSENDIAVLFGDVGVLLQRSPGPAESVESFLFIQGRVRSPDAIRTALRRVQESAEGGRSPLPSTMWGPADQATAVHLFRELALDEQAEALADSLCNRDEITGDWIPATGAIAALELLRRAGVRLAIVSSLGDSLQATLEATGLLSFFERFLLQDAPEPDGRAAGALAAALNQMGIVPGRSWYIGLVAGVSSDPARRAGCKTVLINPTAESGKEAEDTEWQARRVDEAAWRVLDTEGLGAV